MFRIVCVIGWSRIKPTIFQQLRDEFITEGNKRWFTIRFSPRKQECVNMCVTSATGLMKSSRSETIRSTAQQLMRTASMSDKRGRVARLVVVKETVSLAAVVLSTRLTSSVCVRARLRKVSLRVAGGSYFHTFCWKILFFLVYFIELSKLISKKGFVAWIPLEEMYCFQVFEDVNFLNNFMEPRKPSFLVS